MIDLYTYTTPNGRKPVIMLEELELPYTIHKIDIGKGDQFTPEYVAINPNSKIPAIMDRDTQIKVFESGAILIYLAEKTGKLLPTEMADRARVLEWLMFQMAGVGPMFGQLGHFRNAAPENLPYAITRYQNETLRSWVCLIVSSRPVLTLPATIPSLILPSIPGLPQLQQPTPISRWQNFQTCSDGLKQ